MGKCDGVIVALIYGINLLLFGWIAFAVVYGLDCLYPSGADSGQLFSEALMASLIGTIGPTIFWMSGIYGGN